MTFTDLQLKNLARYERVRQSGEFNMLDPRARQASGMYRDEYLFVLKHYISLKAAAESQRPA